MARAFSQRRHGYLAEWLAEQRARPGFQGDPLNAVLAEPEERKER